MKFENKRIKNYYKTKFCKGKNGLARAFDAIFGGLILFFALLLVFWQLKTGLLRAAVLALTGTGAAAVIAAMIRQRRFARFVAAETERLREECLLEKLTLLPRASFRRACREIFADETGTESLSEIYGGFFSRENGRFCYAFRNHPTSPVGVQQLLLLCRKLKQLGAKSAFVLSASPYAEDADTMARRFAIPITLGGRRELLACAAGTGLAISDDEVAASILALMGTRATKEQLKGSFFAKNKIKAYLSCALLLASWNFLIGFNIIYPLAACLCLLLAFLAYRTERRAEENAR